MAAPCFITWNAVTSALSSEMTGTTTTASTKQTILQLKPGSNKIRIVEWGYEFTTVPATAVQMELIETGSVFATVTTGSISNYNDVTGPSSAATTGTAATGFAASAEGTITASRLLAQTDNPTVTSFKQQFPLGREPEVQNGNSVRIRALGPAVTILCYIIWEE